MNKRLLSFCALSLEFFVASAAMAYRPNAPADFVLGQPNFMTSASSTTQNGMGAGSGIAFAQGPVTSTLYVADSSNNRILVYTLANSTQPVTNGMNASYVLGQPNFTSRAAATTQSGMNNPQGLVYDSSKQRLYVADAGNNRVLVYDFTISPISNGRNADDVLDQPNFTSSGSSQLNNPHGIALDARFQLLFVADTGNNRLVEFNLPPGPIPNGMPGTWFWGPDYLLPFQRGGLNGPTGIYVDQGSLNIYIADSLNNIVTGCSYETDALGAVGNCQTIAQTLVVAGQFSSLQNPEAIIPDGNYQEMFFISDTGNNDVIEAHEGDLYSWLGELAANLPRPSQQSLANPMGLAYDPAFQRLYVVDSGNSRVMIFDVFESVPPVGECTPPLLSTGTATPSIVIPGNSYQLRCDFGIFGASPNEFQATSGGAPCSFNTFDGSAALFTCTSDPNSLGVKSNVCSVVNIPGDFNLCNSSFTLNNVDVDWPVPTATPQFLTTPFQTDLPITLAGVDTNTPPLPLSFTVTAQPSNGTLSGTAPNLTYTPNSGFNGTDSFTFTVQDQHATSLPATVAIRVGIPTLAPTATPQSLSVPFQTPTAVTLTGADQNTPPLPLTAVVVTQPANGTLSGTVPNLTYTPNNSFSGADSFTFEMTNNFETSSTATVSIEVSSPGAPSASPQSLTTPFQTDLAVVLAGIDPNTPPLPLTYSVQAQPSHGTLSVSGSSVTYHPNSGFAGSDSFTFTVNDGFFDSPAAAVSITVSSPTAAPTATPQFLSTNLNTALPVTLAGVDPNTPPLALTAVVVTPPANGTLTGTAPNLTYQPNSGFTGADSFTFTVNDGFNTSAAAAITIRVGVGTTAPTADSQNLSTAFQTALPVTLTGTDPNAPPLPLAFNVLTQPAHGILSGTAPNVTYQPAVGFVGSDSFQFNASNGFLTSSSATISIVVSSPTLGPTASPQSLSTSFQTALPVLLTGIDPNIPPLFLTFAVTAQPSHGTLSGSSPNITYQPDTGYSGSDSFAFTASNGYLVSAPATVSITVGTGTINPSLPILTSITPSSATAGGALFTMTLGGSNFVTGSVVQWNGTPRITVYHGPTQLTATISDTDIAMPGTAAVTVLNPAPSGLSNSLPFTIVMPSVLTRIDVQPDGKTISIADLLQFAAQGYDQNGVPINGLTYAWKVAGQDGAISPAGLFRPLTGIQGAQQFTISATANSVTGLAHVTVIVPSQSANDICGAIAHPVPYKSSSGLAGITFSGLAPGSKIRIFTTDGRIVRTLNSSDGTDVLWDTRNDGGGKVASWVYYYIIDQAGTCPKKEGKLVVIQ